MNQDLWQEKRATRFSWGVLFTLVFVGTLIYANSFRAGFQFDDVTLVEKNYELRDLGRILARWWTDIRFLTDLSFALNYHFGKLNLFGYHLVNLAIHVLNSFLVYLLALAAFKTPAIQNTALAHSARRIAFGASLIFLSHPIQTQAVTYIWQRSASLAALACLATLLLYHHARIQRTRLSYMAALAAAFGATATKQITMTLPLVLVAYELIFFGASKKTLKQQLFFLFPFLLTSLKVPVTILCSNLSAITAPSVMDILYRPQMSISRYQYTLTELNVFVTYWRLLILPIRQNLLYEYPIAKNLLQPQILYSITVHLALLAAGFACLKRQKIIAFGIFWFYILLSIEFGPIREPIFEHRLYPVMAGFSLALASLLAAALKDWKRYTAALLVLICVYSAATYRRNELWTDKLKFWEDVFHKSPRGFLPMNNLGILYAERGRLDEAHALFARTIQYYPDRFLGYVNMGAFYNKANMPGEAIRYLEKAVALDPTAYYAWRNLGDAHFNLRHFPQAIESYSKAVDVYPSYLNAHFNLALAYAATRQMDKAILHYRRVLEIDPAYFPAAMQLGRIYRLQEEDENAIHFYEKALRIHENAPEPLYDLGLIYKNRKDTAHLNQQILRLKQIGRSDLANILEH